MIATISLDWFRERPAKDLGDLHGLETETITIGFSDRFVLIAEAFECTWFPPCHQHHVIGWYFQASVHVLVNSRSTWPLLQWQNPERQGKAFFVLCSPY